MEQITWELHYSYNFSLGNQTECVAGIKKPEYEYWHFVTSLFEYNCLKDIPKCEDNIKMDFKGTDFVNVDYIW
jgi:hypothetical protein